MIYAIKDFDNALEMLRGLVTILARETRLNIFEQSFEMLRDPMARILVQDMAYGKPKI